MVESDLILDNMPNCLWIWDVTTLSQVALIQQMSPVKSVSWNPLNPDQLVFCCANSFVYLWDFKSGCESIQVPAGNILIHPVNFTVSSMEWNPDGKSLVIMDKDKFCLAFPIQ